MCDMLDRFYMMHSCIKKALIDFDIEWNFEKNEINSIKEVVDALKLIKETVQFICRRDTNLIQVDISVELLLKHLSSQNTFVAIFFNIFTFKDN